MRRYCTRRVTAGVNQKEVRLRREIVWLPERDTDPNSRMENSSGAIFSMVLNKTRISELRCRRRLYFCHPPWAGPEVEKGRAEAVEFRWSKGRSLRV